MVDVFVGIDLGTTTTLIASASETGSGPKVDVLTIQQKDGSGKGVDMKYLPSLAFFKEGESPYVGLEAQLEGEQDATRFVRAVKRQMGRRLLLPVVNQEPYKVSALYLEKALAEARYQIPVGDLTFTVTVPASFTSNQRADTLQALKLACEKVRLPYPEKDEGLIFISEPVAAMLAFLNTELSRPVELRRIEFDAFRRIVVYDLGGGTLDLTLVSIMPLRQPVQSLAELDIQVELVGYYNPFGGEDFDRVLAQALHERLLTDIPQLCEEQLTKDQRSSVRLQLMNLAKKVKEQISTRAGEQQDSLFGDDEEISYEYGHTLQIRGKAQTYSVEGTLTWEEFKQIIAPLLSGTSRKSLITPLDDLLQKANLESSRLDGLLIVGGMARLPLVEEKLRAYWGNDHVWLYQPPDHAVVTGAALYSYLRKRYPGFHLQEWAADSYYVRTVDGFSEILPARAHQGDQKVYELDSNTDKLLLQIFAGEEPEPGKPLETIYHTLIYQGGTTISLGSTQKRGTPVWIQMLYDDTQSQQDHTKVPWVCVWVGSKDTAPTFRKRYSDLIQEASDEPRVRN